MNRYLNGTPLEEMAIRRIREHCPPEGYVVAFSGGKDSVVVLDLVRRSGCKHTALYSLTTVDPPELVHFIRREYPDVAWHRPEKSMWELIVEHGIPPLRRMRYCCRTLKEESTQNCHVVTGVRAAESPERAKRADVTGTCAKLGTHSVNPIVDWLDGDVWDYIRERHLPRCSVYREGWKRLGCVMCPFANKARDLVRWPKIAAAYHRACCRAFAKPREDKPPFTFASGGEMYEWWISGAAREKDEPGQASLFGD